MMSRAEGCSFVGNTLFLKEIEPWEKKERYFLDMELKGKKEIKEGNERLCRNEILFFQKYYS